MLRHQIESVYAHTPQSDGQTELPNRIVGDVLRHIVACCLTWVCCDLVHGMEPLRRPPCLQSHGRSPGITDRMSLTGLCLTILLCAVCTERNLWQEDAETCGSHVKDYWASKSESEHLALLLLCTLWDMEGSIMVCACLDFHMHHSDKETLVANFLLYLPILAKSQCYAFVPYLQ